MSSRDGSEMNVDDVFWSWLIRPVDLEDFLVPTEAVCHPVGGPCSELGTLINVTDGMDQADGKVEKVV